MRRDAVERIGGFEEAFRGAYEDEVFYAKVCLSAPVFAVDTCWDRYRQHLNSSNSIVERSEQEYATRVVFLDWLADYLSEQGVTDVEIVRGLRKERWRCRHPNLSRLWRSRPHLIRRVVRGMVPSHSASGRD